MNEEGFYAVYGNVEKGMPIKVTWSIPAETSGVGKEVRFSEPGDRGTFEGIEGSTLYIRRGDGTLKPYPLSSVRNVEVLP